MSIRYVKDVGAAEIPLISEVSVEGEPVLEPILPSEVDLSHSILRSPDRCCIQYLKNIRVTSSLTISLIQNNRLWGVISCHSFELNEISTDVLATCQLLSQLISIQLSNVVDSEDRTYQLHLQSLQSHFIQATGQAESLEDALLSQGELLMEMVGAQGAAFCVDGKIVLQGDTPALAEVEDLLQWSKDKAANEVFATHHLSTHYSGGPSIADTASGLLLLWISKTRNSALLWFRPEVLQTIDWAGEPSENLQRDREGVVKLHPRSSFELWQETVRQHSVPWKPCEIENANALRNSLLNLVIAKLEELATINRELERSNQELDSFAYAASHDLKEPLRGIHNYSTFLLEDYADRLDDAAVDRLETLIRLTQRMDSLIDVLLQFAQIGRQELQIKPVDLNDTVEQAIELVTASRPDISAVFSIPRPLPTIHCDPLLIAQMFNNLFSNALKYTDSDRVQVEVGYLTEAEFANTAKSFDDGEGFRRPTPAQSPVLYVRDNGIGIQKHHLETVFRLFKRLHSQRKYGGGAGAGLTIVKKIVERHGGNIWVESTYGEGATFYISGIDMSANGNA
ncbi:MAG: ATP-binding protein [Synechococcus sp.]